MSDYQVPCERDFVKRSGGEATMKGLGLGLGLGLGIPTLSKVENFICGAGGGGDRPS